MTAASSASSVRRYHIVAETKATGATYTPALLADFVASSMLAAWKDDGQRPLRVLDPAVGDGALLVSLLRHLPADQAVEVYGYDLNKEALEEACKAIVAVRPDVPVRLVCDDFLTATFGDGGASGDLFTPPAVEQFDLVIANPPYVRTQVMGAKAARALAERFDLGGRVDLYHAFVLAIAEVLRPHGVAGIIVSNRFMTTKTGAGLRRATRERFDLKHVWDLGDTKLFDAAVLPAVLVAGGLNGTRAESTTFTSIYETKDDATANVASPLAALGTPGVVAVPDGRRYRITSGRLAKTTDAEALWRVATAETDGWLETVRNHTWGTFRDLGKVRVGVKTCADRVFIRDDWHTMPAAERPELLKPLTTHHIGQRYRPLVAECPRGIVYPHEQPAGGRKRAADLADNPRTRAYLEQHRATLESRGYVLEAGRQWYEIWVPQQPAAWPRLKLVFRDISEEPCFWLDRDGTVVNGDCYWLICDDPAQEELLWLAVAVGNSKFIEAFYDHSFNNKLYAGRRRFITQYVEKFPLPDPALPVSQRIIENAKLMYEHAGSTRAATIEAETNRLISSAFGLPVEEV